MESEKIETSGVKRLFEQRENDRGQKERTNLENAKALALLTSVAFWGGLSVFVSLISLALPWWGIDIIPRTLSWGVLSVPAQPALVTFFPDRLDELFSANYGFMTSVVLLTSGLTAIGSYLKRWSLLAVALLSSVVTDLLFIAAVQNALGSECQQTLVAPASCISGLVGSAVNPAGSITTWGFKAGFYGFLASGVLILVALALQRNIAR